MDRVVQQIAASAEESASAAETLNDQCRQTKKHVADMAVVIYGDAARSVNQRSTHSKSGMSAPAESRPDSPIKDRQTKALPSSTADEDFEDF